MFRLALVSLLLFTCSASHAQILLVSISDPSVFTNLEGAGSMQVDLQYDFFFDTADVMPSSGMNNGDLYAGLNYTVTSAALGLDGIAAANQLDFELNPDQLIGTSNDGFLLFTSGTMSTNGVSGFGGVLNSWDGISPLSVTGGSGPATGGFSGLQTTLVDGRLLDGSSFNFNDTTVTIAAIPEPNSLVVIVGMAGTLLCRRRKNYHLAN